jgi:hypothetical protein
VAANPRAESARLRAIVRTEPDAADADADDGREEGNEEGSEEGNKEGKDRGER